MPPSTPTPDTPTQQCAGSSSTSHHLNVDKPRTPPHTTSGTCLASCDNCNPVTTSNNQTAQGPHKESCGLAIADFISSSYTSSSSDESGPDCAPELGSTFNTYTAAGQRNYSSGACKTRSCTESTDPSTYSGPQFIYDTGATSSFGSTRTPLDSTSACYRRIRGIGSNFCIARKEGPCKAIPNVALSNCFGRNLASVSQLTRAHNNQLTFDKDRVSTLVLVSHPTLSHPGFTSLAVPLLLVYTTWTWTHIATSLTTLLLVLPRSQLGRLLCK